MILNSYELYSVQGGGFSLTYSALNALSRMVTTLFKLGQSIGSSIKRAVTKNYC